MLEGMFTPEEFRVVDAGGADSNVTFLFSLKPRTGDASRARVRAHWLAVRRAVWR